MGAGGLASAGPDSMVPTHSLGAEGRLDGRLQLSLLPQKGQTWPMPNCSQATCEGNNVITVGPRPCPHVPEPTCANGYPALKVPDQDGCCLHYQCQCEPGSPPGGRAGTRVRHQEGLPNSGQCPGGPLHQGVQGRAAQAPLRPPPAPPGRHRVMTWRLRAPASRLPLVPGADVPLGRALRGWDGRWPR